MEEEYMDTQDSGMNDVINRASDGNDSAGDPTKDFGDASSYDDAFDDEDGGNSFRGGRGGRGNFRYNRLYLFLNKSLYILILFLHLFFFEALFSITYYLKCFCFSLKLSLK